MRRVIVYSAAALGLLSAGQAGAQALFNEPGAVGLRVPEAEARPAVEPEVTGSTRYRVISAVDPRTGAAPPPAARPASGQYGGGFIEFLMTGRDPGEARPVMRGPVAIPQAIPGRRPASPGYGVDEQADARAMRARRRMAALPPSGGVEPGLDEEERGIRRAVSPQFRRQVVEYDGPHKPGTIVIDTPSKFLYLVQPGGKAVRYGIGVGRPGFEWAGMKTVTRKAEWPDWTPPPAMLKRRPDLPRFMKGGPNNPLGARALYLGSSLYRIHGTNEPHTIGQAVSSGCIRMMNEDVIDLYNRVGVGAKVMVI